MEASLKRRIHLSRIVRFRSIMLAWMMFGVELIGQTGNKQSKANSIRVKRKVFGPVAPTSPHAKLIGYKWVFVRKSNEKNEIMRYKACLVTQGFSQCLEINHDEIIHPLYM
ncbi:hypothetical protein ACFX16_038407 [Malus domestica]